MPDAGIRELTEADFDEQIQGGDGPVVVDFWTSWCEPCKRIVPALEQLAEELRGRVTIVKVDVDQNGDLASRFGIRSVPTLMVFKQGRVVDQMIGVAPKEQIRRVIHKHLG